MSPLDEIRERIAPVALAGQQQLPVPSGLVELFPDGGLPSGWSVGIEGSGAWSLTAMLVGALVAEDRWVALVGADELGLVAAHELGLPLDRTLLVEHPTPDVWSTVVAALLEAVGVIGLNPTHPVNRRDARRLSARAREQKAVLLHLDGGRHWPEALDLTLSAQSGPWEGLGRGCGHLRHRRLTVEAQGRRSMSLARQTTLTLPAERVRTERVRTERVRTERVRNV